MSSNSTRTYQAEAGTAPIWASEPFRVFFPLGCAASTIGVLIWPLFYAGWWPFSPILQHPRLMIFGFGFAFVIGFLGTAWPRFLEAKALRPIEVVSLGISWGASVFAYITNHIQLGDIFFVISGLLLIAILLLRTKGKNEFPPPGFLLAFSTVVLSIGIVIYWLIKPSIYPPYHWSRLIVWQGLLLFPILGVGSYLIPRFFITPIKITPRNRALGVWLSALVIFISFFIESSGMIRTGNGIRVLGLIIWAGLAVPSLWKSKNKSTRAWALRFSTACIFLTFLIRSFWPGPVYANEHLFFIGGIGMMILLIAERVSVGHGGGDLANPKKKSKLWRWIVWLIVLAATTRMSADMKMSIMISHYIYAALLWVVILGIWLASTWKFWQTTGE